VRRAVPWRNQKGETSMTDSTQVDRFTGRHRATLTRQELFRVAAALGVAGAGLGLTACGSSSSSGTSAASAAGAIRRGGTLKLAVTDASSAEKLDPAVQTVTNDALYCSQIYECLTRSDESWQVTPLLAEKWEANADLTEWTLTLRPGVVFHDGSPLTSKDVVWSLQRILDPDLGSALYSRFAESVDKDGVQAPDDQTVVLKLKRPDALMPLALSERQAKIVKDGTSDFTVSTAIGTGPFKVKSWTPGQSWSLVKNDAYWEKGLPYLDGIQAVIIGEQATKVQSVVSGSNDLGDPIDPSTASSVTSSSTASLLSADNSYYLELAMDQTQKPFDDLRVVQAVKLVQDRAQLVQTVVQGFGESTGDTPAPPSDPYYPADLGVPERNIEEAKRLLAEAGYPDGIELELFTAPAYGGMVDLAVAFQQQAKDAGITVKLNQWPAATYWSEVWLVKPFYAVYWNRRHPGQAASITFASNAPWNQNKLADPELDALISEGLATADEARESEIYPQLLKRIADEHGSAIPVFGHKLWVRRNNVNGVETDLTNYLFFRKTWLS
jgi:peptide/nickel transport system substrate-binding protein